jgi:hypothetical protein
MAQKFNLLIDQGSTFKASLTVFDLLDNNFDLTPYAIKGQIRKYHKSEAVIATFTTTKVTPLSGIFTIELTDEQTATIPAGEYVYDIVIEDQTDVYRIIEGIVRVAPQVTRNPPV